ncbi:MAG: hypothetical protein RIR66_142 [Actinomycetota bacterium]|jgi:hypothetical protein
MRFLIEVLDHSSNTASNSEMAEIDKFNEFLKSNGHWVMACGIDSTSKSLIIDNRNDLGFSSSETNYKSEDFVSGFWLIEALDTNQAIEIALAGSKACNRKVELRPLL